MAKSRPDCDLQSSRLFAHSFLSLWLKTALGGRARVLCVHCTKVGGSGDEEERSCGFGCMRQSICCCCARDLHIAQVRHCNGLRSSCSGGCSSSQQSVVGQQSEAHANERANNQSRGCRTRQKLPRTNKRRAHSASRLLFRPARWMPRLTPRLAAGTKFVPNARRTPASTCAR